MPVVRGETPQQQRAGERASVRGLGLTMPSGAVTETAMAHVLNAGYDAVRQGLVHDLCRNGEQRSYVRGMRDWHVHCSRGAKQMHNLENLRGRLWRVDCWLCRDRPPVHSVRCGQLVLSER